MRAWRPETMNQGLRTRSLNKDDDVIGLWVGLVISEHTQNPISLAIAQATQ